MVWQACCLDSCCKLGGDEGAVNHTPHELKQVGTLVVWGDARDGGARVASYKLCVMKGCVFCVDMYTTKTISITSTR